MVLLVDVERLHPLIGWASVNIGYADRDGGHVVSVEVLKVVVEEGEDDIGLAFLQALAQLEGGLLELLTHLWFGRLGEANGSRRMGHAHCCDNLAHIVFWCMVDGVCVAELRCKSAHRDVAVEAGEAEDENGQKFRTEHDSTLKKERLIYATLEKRCSGSVTIQTGDIVP